MNRSETKLLVENWRNLLRGEEYTCGVDFLESCNFEGKILNEAAAIQKASTNKSKLLNTLAVLMLSSSFGGALNKVQAKNVRGAADDAFSEMDNAFKKEDLNEAEKEEKFLMTMLDILEEAGMSSRTRRGFEEKYKSSGPETKAIIIMICHKKVKSLAPEVARRGKKDPLVKKYDAVDFAQKDAKGQKDGKGEDEKGEFIIKNGKKFYLTSTKVDVTHFRNQKAIDKMKNATKGRR